MGCVDEPDRRQGGHASQPEKIFMCPFPPLPCSVCTGKVWSISTGCVENVVAFGQLYVCVQVLLSSSRLSVCLWRCVTVLVESYSIKGVTVLEFVTAPDIFWGLKS